MPHPLQPLPRGHSQEPPGSGSVRRAREQVGAGLSYFPYDSGDQSKIAPVIATRDTAVNRSLSQASGHWTHETQNNTAQDILHHPLMTQPVPGPPSTGGELDQGFKFPGTFTPPAIPSTPSRRSRDLIPPSSRRPGPNYVTPAQVSPIVEETESSIRSKSLYSHASTGVRSSGVLAPNFSRSQLTLRDQHDDESVATSTPPSPVTPALPEGSQVVRQASVGKRGKPAITNIRSWGADQQNFKADRMQRQQTEPPVGGRQATLNALTAAVAAVAAESHGNPKPPSRAQFPRTNTGSSSLRMPFESDPSPLSNDDDRALDDLQAPQQSFALPGRERSQSPLLAANANGSDTSLHRPGMSDRIPSDRRPPMLDMNAVHASDRASTTSLTDMIRRATKLASNLDRGKTASRLGLLDMFYGDDKPNRRQRNPNEKRGSGISDMLSAFPAVASQSNLAKWPDEGVKMERYPPTDKSSRKKSRRRCCGLNLTAFMIIVLILIVLIAAAVLVPLFLIVFPRQHNSTSNAITVDSCKKSFKCHHGGQSVVVAGSCSCVCAGPWRGKQCDTSGTNGCITAKVPGLEIPNASMGTQIPTLLQDSQKNFSIPLDSGTILGLFSQEGVSCSNQNSLISFSDVSTTRRKRFYPLPAAEEELALELIQKPAATVPPEPIAKRGPDTVDKADLITPRASTSNGIVFEESSTSSPPDIATTAIPSLSAAPQNATTSTPTPSTSSSVLPSISPRLLNFSRIVVLYVLEQSAQLSMALNAQQLLKYQLLSGNIMDVVEVGYGNLDLRADLKGMRLLWGNGTVIGR